MVFEDQTTCEQRIAGHVWVWSHSVYLKVVLKVYSASNPNSLDNKGSCWILKDFYCSVTMLTGS